MSQVALALLCTVADSFAVEALHNQITSALSLSTATLMNFNNDCTESPWTRLFVSLGGHSLLNISDLGDIVAIELHAKTKGSFT